MTAPQAPPFTPPTQKATSVSRLRWVTGGWSSAVVPAGPLEADPGGFLPGEERLAFLAGVLDGIELGAWDLRIVGWLSGLGTSTALTIASLIARAREAGPGRWA